MNKCNLNRSLVALIVVLLSFSYASILTVNSQEEDTWTTLASMPIPREGLGLAVVK